MSLVADGASSGVRVKISREEGVVHMFKQLIQTMIKDEIRFSYLLV